MLIGLGQLDIEWENKEINRIKCFNMIKEATDNGVDLIIFPEMSLTGFSMNTSFIGEITEASSTIDFFRQQSLDMKIAIGFGYVEVLNDTSNKSIENTMSKTIIGPKKKATNRFVVMHKGEMLMNYAKIHPFSYSDEGLYYEGGTSLGSFSLGDFNFGGFICYDLRFPEIFQASSINNQVLIVIANWPKARVDHFRTLLKARAIENQCYVIGVNRVGGSNDIGDGIIYEGSSGIYSPIGELITNEFDYEKLIIGEISLDIVNECRNSFRHRDDKKPDLYKTFY